MKNKSLAFLSTLICTSTFFSATTYAAERWFEMEVILFSQLGDKSKLIEEFAQNSELPTYKKHIDLLSDYLQPDVRSMKNLFPICGEKSHSSMYMEAINTLSNVFPIKSLALIEQQTPLLLEGIELNVINDKPFENIQENNGLESNPLTADRDAELTLQNNNDLLLTDDDMPQEIDAQELIENKAITQQAEQYFNEKLFIYRAAKVSKNVCLLSEQDITALQEQDPSFDADYYPVTTITKTVNNIETPYTGQPYLLNKDSLALKDIVLQLKRSKNFKPLMHIGWRQAAVSKRKAVPIKIYAGENLLLDYRRQLERYNTEMSEAEDQELALQSILMSNVEAVDPEQPVTISSDDIQQVINSLNEMPTEQSLLIDGLIDYQTIIDDKNKTPATMPVAPPQNWSIDGFFNVHLNHYLYITADFNVVDKSLAEQATGSLAKGSPQAIHTVSFSQNKRVISKEIHYFDHPYMGMIVQIRRHSRPAPKH